ncbi:recombinase RecT [Proteiniphilum acetatigenes]|uniref:recombinase RecT n=1 Tax=Proteiniphilum acetatigenes TaxID=294710 RepID=UPI00037533DF|nr:recombinase RecT [Proteiniphilum acetatigenes]
MSTAIQIRVEEINALEPAKIVESPKVEQKFIQMYNAIHGTDKGVQMYQKEVFNFQKVLQENPALQECSKMSLYGCFLDMAVNGLSLDPTGRPHCYLIPRSTKTGYKDEKGNDIYEKRASVSVTGYGELVMRMRAGQIKYADNPVVVYEGDVFSINLDQGIKKITYSAAIPRKSNKIVGAFIRIVRNDGSEDYQWLLEGDIDRLKGFSERANSYWDKNARKRVIGKANELYSSNGGQIDPGFLENKMIKHAFDAYPKVKIGKFTNMQSLEEPEQEIDYGIEEGEAEVINNGFDEPETVQQPEIVQPAVTVEDEDEGW